MIDYKNAILDSLEVKKDGNQGIFEGYASIFENEDLGGDIVKQGAFTNIKTTKSGHARLTIGHDLNRICGKCDFKQDEKGLFVKGYLNLETTNGKDAYEHLKDGTIDELSFGYKADKFMYNDDNVREIKELTLYEVALVPFAMNPQAKITAVKKELPNIRIAEKYLTEQCGYTRKEAKTILSKKRDVDAKRDAETEEFLSEYVKRINEDLL